MRTFFAAFRLKYLWLEDFQESLLVFPEAKFVRQSHHNFHLVNWARTIVYHLWKRNRRNINNFIQILGWVEFYLIGVME